MEPRKKILFIITKSNFGGAQRYVFDLATHLPKDRFDVLVAFGGAGLLKTKLTEAGIRTYEIRSFERDINLRKECDSLRELYKLIRAEQPDIVHLNSSKAGGSGAFMARLLGVKKIVFTAHGWPFHEPRQLLWRALAWFFSYLTAILVHTVIVVSARDKERAYMPGLQNKIIHIPTAIGEISFLPRLRARAFLAHAAHTSISDDTLLVGSIGEYVKNKNLLAAIRAVEKIRDSAKTPMQYLLIGTDGDERPVLERYIEEHGLSDTVVLAGFIDNARHYLTAFDIFLMPSLKEGLPYGLLEAGAAALPVVASSVGGIPEIITDHESGRLIDPHDEAALANALSELLESPTKRTTLGDALQKKVAIAFRLDTMLTQTKAVYMNTTQP